MSGPPTLNDIHPLFTTTQYTYLQADYEILSDVLTCTVPPLRVESSL